jgi:predicted HAD superfamily Cof-like phosphohydrolase
MSRTLELVAKADATEHEVQLEFELGLPPRLMARRPRRSNGVSRAMQSVAEFHMSFRLPHATTPQRNVGPDFGELRVELLREEFEEFKDAVARDDTVAIADALGDIVYVAYGAALTYGIDLDAVLAEIHRANMSKLGKDGEPLLREDGKVLKPPTYVAPDVRRVLLDQPPLFLD